jgi:hypothetical protein
MSSGRRFAGAWLLALALTGVACSPPPAATPPPPKPKPRAARSDDAVRVHRAELDAVLAQGPPWVLSRVDIEEVLDSGKFVGWRMRDVPVAWSDVDLRPGDVVMAINSMPLETPDQFFAVWSTLTVASEIRVKYLRDGEERELRIPVDGSPNPRVAKQLTREQPAPKADPDKKRRDTVIIKGDDKPLTDTDVE